jgi:hypothetical protein
MHPSPWSWNQTARLKVPSRFESRKPGTVPPRLDRAPSSAREHHVERTVAAHLVGEAGPISRTGVMSIRNVAHRRTV